MVNMRILQDTLEGMASDADDKGEKDFGLRLTVEDAFALCKLDEVVRCKDCKHSEVYYGDTWCNYLLDSFGKSGDVMVDANWFCGDGERKDDAAADI